MNGCNSKTLFETINLSQFKFESGFISTLASSAFESVLCTLYKQESQMYINDCFWSDCVMIFNNYHWTITFQSFPHTMEIYGFRRIWKTEQVYGQIVLCFVSFLEFCKNSTSSLLGSLLWKIDEWNEIYFCPQWENLVWTQYSMF